MKFIVEGGVKHGKLLILYGTKFRAAAGRAKRKSYKP